MKNFLYKTALGIGISAIVFSSCKKEGIGERAQNSQQTEETVLKAKAEKALQHQNNEVEFFNNQYGSILNESELSEAGRHKATIVDIAIKLPFFKSLVAAVVKTGLAPTLSSSSLNATVFAPTDAAFAKLPAPFNNAVNISAITDPGQVELLKTILLYHVLGSEIKKRQIADGTSNAETLKSMGLTNDNTIYISKQFGLVAVNGSSLVLLADVNASNGVIHVINNVLRFPTNTIAGIAIGNPDFSTLVAALVRTNLASVFTGSGDFTVFAPTDDAFAELPAPFNNPANIAAISDPAQVDALSNILRYHVIASRRFTIDLGFFSSFQTLADAPANKLKGLLGLNNGYVKGKSNSNYAKIDPGNILATNGLVHVINKVLLP